MKYISKLLIIILYIAYFLFDNPLSSYAASLSAIGSFQATGTLNGKIEDISADGVLLRVLNPIVLLGGWDISVEASPLTQTGGMKFTLPSPTLFLDRPVAVDSSYDSFIHNDIWPLAIDTGNKTTIITYQKILGLNLLIMDFNQKAIIRLHPERRTNENLSTPATFTSTITWTFITTGISI